MNTRAARVSVALAASLFCLWTLAADCAWARPAPKQDRRGSSSPTSDATSKLPQDVKKALGTSAIETLKLLAKTLAKTRGIDMDSAELAGNVADKILLSGDFAEGYLGADSAKLTDTATDYVLGGVFPPYPIVEPLVEARLRWQLRQQGLSDADIDKTVIETKHLGEERALELISDQTSFGFVTTADRWDVVNSAVKQAVNGITGGSLLLADPIDEFMASEQANQVARAALTAGVDTSTGGAFTNAEATSDFVSSGQAAKVAGAAASAALNSSTADDEALKVFEQAHSQVIDRTAQQKQLSDELASLTTQVQDAQADGAALKGQDQQSYATSRGQAESSINAATVQDSRNPAPIAAFAPSTTNPSFGLSSDVSGLDWLQSLLRPLSQPGYANRPRQRSGQPAQNATRNKPIAPLDCGFLSGYAAGCLQSCMNLACLGGCDGAMVAQCQSDYPKQLTWERKAMAECKAGYPIQIPSTNAQLGTKPK
jgi:hypothetical protein